jgi:hypothetical protein
MSHREFQLIALRLIRAGEPLYGTYFVDHHDGTVYLVTRWVNAPMIAFDEYWTPETKGYRDAYLAALDPSYAKSTQHFARTGTL